MTFRLIFWNAHFYWVALKSIHKIKQSSYLSLKKIASVDSPSIHNDNKRMIYLTNKNGKEKLLRTDKIKEDGFVRYKNFNPPEPYEYEELNQ